MASNIQSIEKDVHLYLKDLICLFGRESNKKRSVTSARILESVCTEIQNILEGDDEAYAFISAMCS